MVRNDIKNSSLLKTKFLIYAFNGRTRKQGVLLHGQNIPSFLQRTSSHPTPLLQQGVETANHISSINCLDKTPNLPKLTNTINPQTNQLH